MEDIKTPEVKQMIEYILEIDALSTVEFCTKFNAPVPFFTGEVKSSADQFLQIDAIKQRLFTTHAKLLFRSGQYESLTLQLSQAKTQFELLYKDFLDSRTELLESKEESKRLASAAELLCHYHSCEQEGIANSQPTPSQWFNAVNGLQEALQSVKKGGSND